MITRELNADIQGIAEAVRLLKAGELVAIPTETVYGLAADALSPAAVAKIFEAKGRPQDNPLIVHVNGLAHAYELAGALPDAARALIGAFWPGPLTLVLPRGERVPAIVSAGLDTVAVRQPAHPAAREIIAGAGPLAAPSANRSGTPSPTTAAHVLADLDGRIAAVVQGGPCRVGLESTVVDMTRDRPRVLRPGAVTPAMLREVVGEIEIDPAVEGAAAAGPVSSPGMKYKHYAPRTPLVLVKGGAAAFAAYVNARREAGAAAIAFDGEDAALAVPAVTYGGRDNHAAQAHRIFDALRRVDALHVRVAYCACPEPDGIGLAVYNRLLRAAEFEVVTLD